MKQVIDFVTLLSMFWSIRPEARNVRQRAAGKMPVVQGTDSLFKIRHGARADDVGRTSSFLLAAKPDKMVRTLPRCNPLPCEAAGVNGHD
jgi:hypothetical protein